MLSKEDQYWFVEDIPKISECLRDLKDAINERNKFAHGTIVIDEEKMKVTRGAFGEKFHFFHKFIGYR